MLGSKRNYFYLVAGLPELLIDQSKVSIALTDFKEELQHHLHPRDYQLIRQIFMFFDNHNILNLLNKKENSFLNLGNYSATELEELIKDPVSLPPYFIRFIHHFKDDIPVYEGFTWENQLTSLYYEYVCENGIPFTKSWFSFDLNLRNIITAINGKKHQIDIDYQLIGKNPVNDALLKSHAKDFGLSSAFPFIDKLVQLHDSDNLMEREMGIDLIRWDFLDQLNTFNYFTIEVLIAFTIKLSIVERWNRLSAEKGKTLFNKFLSELESSYKLPNEFLTTYGKN